MNPHSPSIDPRSLVVLPFVNMSNDPENEYFSDGITEEIINALTRVSGLRVIARTSSFAYKGQHIDVRRIGRELGVTTILEGSVRKARNKVRITAQLVRATDGFHLWSKNFDRELADIFALQDEISLLIADQIRENFGHIEIGDRLVEIPTQNIDAYSLYLKGRYHQLKWNAADLQKAAEYYEQCVQQDPAYVLPYFGAGLTYGILASWGFMPSAIGYQRSAQFLEKGLKLDKDLYLGHFAQATVRFWAEWDFRKGHQHLIRAIELNPAFTDAEEGLAELYTAIGEFDKARQHVSNILSLNPLSPNHHYTLGNIHYLSGEYEQALSCMRELLRLDPDWALGIEVSVACLILIGDYSRLDAFIRAHPQAEKPHASRALFRLLHRSEEVPIDHESLRARTVAYAAEGQSSLIPWNLYLQIYLGKHELALDTLEAGIQARQGQFINFQHDPFLQPLRDHPRYKNLIAATFAAVNLPDLSRQQPMEKPVDSKVLLNGPESEHFLSILQTKLEEEQLFLNPDLTLKSLAGQIELHPNKLSWLLNARAGKNFNEFINGYRLRAFQQKASDPSNQHLTLLGLAYESGFNSKTVFNAFFKKEMGMTPSAWVIQQRNRP